MAGNAGLTSSLFNMNSSTTSGNFPAGVAGSPINLGLDHPEGASVIDIVIHALPTGWTIEGAENQSDGSWLVRTTDASNLTVTTPVMYAGAAVLDVTMTWTSVDGTEHRISVANNVEAFAPDTPIFAWNGDDHLTGSAGADTFAFSNPIGFDTIYSFDAAHDHIDLIGYDGFNSFQDVTEHLSSNANGDAVITLADGQTITLNGVAGSSLTDSNFVFNETPQVSNSGSMTVGNGAMLPLSGDLTNTGTISLLADGSETLLQIIQRGLTLTGGGHVTLSDDANNVISGTLSSVTLVNMDNTISGAGQLGAGMLLLDNRGTINATGLNALTIDTGTNVVTNSGTLGATDSGALLVSSALDNSGLLWANGGKLTFSATVSGVGDAQISGNGAVEFHAGSTADVIFDSSAAGTLTLDAPTVYSGVVSGFDGNDVIDFGGLSSVSSYSYAESADHLSGILTINSGPASVQLHFAGDYDASDFVFSADEDGSMLLKVQHHDALIGSTGELML
jgi:hypothetical protein